MSRTFIIGAPRALAQARSELRESTVGQNASRD